MFDPFKTIQELADKIADLQFQAAKLPEIISHLVQINSVSKQLTEQVEELIQVLERKRQ